jgi:hypothetical protein
MAAAFGAMSEHEAKRRPRTVCFRLLGVYAALERGVEDSFVTVARSGNARFSSCDLEITDSLPPSSLTGTRLADSNVARPIECGRGIRGMF